MKIPTFLKWAGGKRRLLSQIDPHLPNKIINYYEPFLGGGSMFFYIKQKYKPENCVISDINKDLIETFKAVRDSPKELIKHLKKLKTNNSKEFYYITREKFNKGRINGIKRCAVFIYLNKTCFNGLYRVNTKNEFNVPYGKYKNPEIFNEETLLEASKLLQGVSIKCQDYDKIVFSVSKGDFVYLDPCYDPLKKTSFAKYTPLRFTEGDNEKLSIFITRLRKKGAKVLLSNNITEGVKSRYPENEGYEWIIVECPRYINSIATGRGNINELLIKSY